ncbi:unnamed protein product [Paramecium sonneborni]|uniref:Uncharacterized protein n=1 Tax=Paramecium sonneborni TaxID=65129 RepID=A0A8S1R1E9_9CILI|nr:unnamed protein product [Paramecium sonneborni]
MVDVRFQKSEGHQRSNFSCILNYTEFQGWNIDNKHLYQSS